VSDITPPPSPENDDAAESTGPKTAAAPGGQASRRPLIAAGVAVVVLMVVIGLLITRNSDSTVPATSAAPTTVATDLAAAGVLETVPPGSAEPPTTVDPAKPVSVDPLPASPFLVASPNRPGGLPVYPSAAATAPKVTLPNPVVPNAKEPKVTVPLVVLVKQDVGNGWLEVYLPIRPNGSTGFIRSADVKLTPHTYHIEVRLGAFNLKAFKDGKVILDAPIAIADDSTPTPPGLYFTNMLLQPTDPKGAYGTYAYGLSGYSDVLQSFGGGPGQLGIHGTNEPQKMGQKVSHGCVRLRNQDIEQLAKILPLGVPVQIFP
jgi:lipoprotein-anchoring transpeptidase ErfK/SrfK